MRVENEGQKSGSKIRVKNEGKKCGSRIALCMAKVNVTE